MTAWITAALLLVQAVGSVNAVACGCGHSQAAAEQVPSTANCCCAAKQSGECSHCKSDEDDTPQVCHCNDRAPQPVAPANAPDSTKTTNVDCTAVNTTVLLVPPICDGHADRTISNGLGVAIPKFVQIVYGVWQT